jgi:hypothetical protein
MVVEHPQRLRGNDQPINVYWVKILAIATSGALTSSVAVVAASFAAVVLLVLWWLPTSVSGYVALFAAILFWPCYVTLLVMWLRTGRVRYLGLLAAMTVPASIFWHHLTVVALSA